mmetsp:Transcript_57589/g.160403  ORF Transcript_57589/g.160403 Transcript_57589/m.160403 type:complete len:339 (+) Transcript_57589:1583-2599(+)
MTSRAVCAHSLQATARNFSSAKRFCWQKLPAIFSRKLFVVSRSWPRKPCTSRSHAAEASSIWAMCMLTSSSRRMRAVRSSESCVRFSANELDVACASSICISNERLTSASDASKASCSDMRTLTPASKQTSISSASSRSRSAWGVEALSAPSAARTRSRRSHKRTVRERSLSASTARRCSRSLAKAVRIDPFEIRLPAAPWRRRSLLAASPSGGDLWQANAVNSRSRRFVKAGSASLCQRRFSSARARRAHGPHFGYGNATCFSLESELPATRTSSNVGQSASAPGNKSRSAADRNACVSGAFSASGPPERRSSARSEAARPQASINASKPWLRRRPS